MKSTPDSLKRAPVSADYTRTFGTGEGSPQRQRSRCTGPLFSPHCSGCETWTVYQCHARKLNHFHTTCLTKPLGIKWQDNIPYTEVLTCADVPSIYTILMQSQLRWAGHVAYMSDDRLPKRLLFGELQQGSTPKVDRRSVSRTHMMISCPQRCQSMRGQQDHCGWRMQASQEEQSCQPCNSHHHSLSTLPETLSGTDWPDQSPADPQSPLTPTPGWLDGHRRNDGQTTPCDRLASHPGGVAVP